MLSLILFSLAGAAAGSVTGILGTGGGLILVPLLTMLLRDSPERIFPSSIAIMLPICATSLIVIYASFPWNTAMPYFIGSCLGGAFAVCLSKRVSSRLLRKAFGVLLVFGGVRFLCS